MKTLHLPLKKKWYEMIESGVKTEEYREIKPYWVKRLTEIVPNYDLGRYGHIAKKFTHIKFSYGYTKRTMTFECKGIRIGKGRPEWGAPDKEVFIIELGERL